MKARLMPVYFEGKKDSEMKSSLDDLRRLLFDEVEILEPLSLEASFPEAEAILLPYLPGKAVEVTAKLRELNLPILILTTEFGTGIMWNWELARCLEEEGVEIYVPPNLETTKRICRALSLKRELENARFLIFEKRPLGDFVWGMERFPEMLKEKFGIRIIKQPQEALAQQIEKISDEEATKVWNEWSIPAENVPLKEVIKSIKLYLCLKQNVEKENVQGIGMPCWGEEAKALNYTPACLAYIKLFEEKGILGACEGDTLSLATMFIINRFFSIPVMMSNVYTFLMKEPVTKHEKIDKLPEVKEPENCLLVAHCGYLGLVPREISTQFTVRPSVLDLFCGRGIAIDACLSEGEITLVKLHPFLNKIHVVEANLERYVQFPHSDCRKGAVVRIKDGQKFVDTIYSHHYVIVHGHLRSEDMSILAKTLNLHVEEI